MMGKKHLPYTLEETLMCVKEALKDYKGKFKAYKKFVKRTVVNKRVKFEDYFLEVIKDAYENVARDTNEILNIKEFWIEIKYCVYFLEFFVDPDDEAEAEVFDFFNYVAEKCEKKFYKELEIFLNSNEK